MLWFCLPLANPMTGREALLSDAALSGVTSPPEGELQDLNVLYIEDNRVNALVMQGMFRALPGGFLRLAASAEEGLQMVQHDVPDVILLDLNLPGIDGFEALRRLRDDPQTGRIPLAAVSADAIDETTIKVQREGSDAFLVKPVDFDRLLQVLKQVQGKN